MLEDLDPSAPNTFEHCAAGHPGATWNSSAGQNHRLDYVLLPTERHQRPVRAYPARKLELAI
eukprot:569871-Alexandrium_andersonii.AAC.1